MLLTSCHVPSTWAIARPTAAMLKRIIMTYSGGFCLFVPKLQCHPAQRLALHLIIRAGERGRAWQSPADDVRSLP